MFDTYISQTEQVTREVTVKEYRAPTDESIKLLNEMQKKALDNIISQFSTSNNCLQMKCAVIEDYYDQAKVFICKFTLNGKDHRFDIKVHSWDVPTEQDLINKVYERTCAELAAEFMQPLFNEMKSLHYHGKF